MADIYKINSRARLGDTMRSRSILLVAIAASTVALVTVAACGEDEAAPTAVPTTAASSAPAGTGASTASLPDKIRAPHFVNSFPAHGETLVQTPEVVVFNFDFNLNPGSAIDINRDGQQVDSGPLSISDDELSMRVLLEQKGADGMYETDYKACWPDGSCHDGTVGFIVDSAGVAQYQDLRGETTVSVPMKDGFRFEPARMIISPGTTVTWVNDSADAHFVNSDPHPSHNVIKDLNSSRINPGESYTFTFEEAGAWGYHCSAHFNSDMIAQVIVE